LPGAIADEQLVLEQQRLGGDGADATGAEELRKGDQQVDDKDEDFSHRANRTISAGTYKTARRVRPFGSLPSCAMASRSSPDVQSKPMNAVNDPDRRNNGSHSVRDLGVRRLC
jgi:hypothetical protein